MIKKAIKYTDFNGVERNEDFFFNLSRAEIAEMELSEAGGLSTSIQKMVAEEDNSKIIKMFKEILLKSYGEKTVDGRRFIKSKEISEAFSQTEAYSVLFMELVTDENKMINFMENLVPKAN